MEEQVVVLRLMTENAGQNEEARASAAAVARPLVEACQRGDRQAFQQLFEIYKDKVYSIAIYFFHGDEASAHDVTQQVFLKLFTRIGQFQYGANFSTWLYRIVTNACLDEQRKRRRMVSVESAPEVMSTNWSQEQQYLRGELAGSVQAAVAQLRPKLRLPILLKYVEGLSYEEMAVVLGCSKGTVASRLNRGHKALAQKLRHLRDTLTAE